MSQADIAQELHKPARKNYRRRKVITYGIDDLWQADLVEMIPYASVNDNYRYLLTIIDTFSKFSFAIPVKDKTGKNVTEAFKSVLQNNRKPKNLQTDAGKEFYNKDFKKLMKDYNINHYSSFSDKKASIVERYNKTLKNKMWLEFSSRGSYKWLEMLPLLVNQYNNTKHRTIKMKPIEVTKEKEALLLKTVYKQDDIKIEKPKFKVGDKVRISKYKHVFDKGYLPNWTNEIFTVEKVIHSNPITYKLKDVLGNFYKEELMETKYPDVYLVEKVIRKRGNRVFVKWLGFPSSYNSWIDIESS